MKAVVSGLIILFLTAMFASLFVMASGANMHGEMSQCPFSAHGEVLCTMHLGEHIEAWKSTFLASTHMLVILIMTALVVCVGRPQNLLRNARVLLQRLLPQVRERTYSFVYRPLQEYFARGILHPKVF